MTHSSFKRTSKQLNYHCVGLLTRISQCLASEATFLYCYLSVCLPGNHISRAAYLGLLYFPQVLSVDILQYPRSTPECSTAIIFLPCPTLSVDENRVRAPLEILTAKHLSSLLDRATIQCRAAMDQGEAETMTQTWRTTRPQGRKEICHLGLLEIQADQVHELQGKDGSWNYKKALRK
jgi:hypothetical protein